MRTLKKLSTILLIVLVAMLSFLSTESLADEGDLKITVTGDVAGRTLSVYKFFNLIEVNKDNNEYVYSWDGLQASEDFFTSKGYDTVAKATDYLKGFNDDSTELVKIAEEYYKYCKDNNIEAEIQTITAENTDESVEFTVNGNGYYLVYDETTASLGEGRVIAAAMLQNVTENTNIKLKAEKVIVDKTVEDTQGQQQKAISAAIGEKVNFTVKSKVPNVVGYDEYTFVVTDTLSKGLTLNNDIKVTIGGTEYTYYDIETLKNNDETTTLTITFDSSKFAKLNDKMGQEIIITYSATLNANAVSTDNTNNVEITYSNSPSTTVTTIPSKVHIYTYSIDFTKKNSAGNALNGAKFVLKLSNGNYAKFDSNGVFTGETTNKEEATVLESTGTELIESNEEDSESIEKELGNVKISGLKAGSYTLIEIEAPEGYSLPNFEFTFTINQEVNDDGTLKTASFEYTADDNNTVAKGYMTEQNGICSTTFTIDILNAKEGALPTTGGIGTTIFTVIGITVMAMAVVVIIMRNRKNSL